MTKAHGERDVIIQAGQKREVLLYTKNTTGRPQQKHSASKTYLSTTPQLAFCQKRSQRIIGDTIKLL